MLKELIAWYLGSLETGGYPLIALLMAVESSIVPLPSEVVIPPAAHLAHTTGKFSLVGITLAGALGSWVGAAIMYWVSRLAGRPFVVRYGRYALVTPDKVVGAENWARRFGAWGVFVARLLPVVRHLVGIPAGIVRLDFGIYSLYTLIGSALWCGVLCWLGVTMGQDQALLEGNAKRIGLWLGGILVALALVYYFLVHRYMKPAATGDGPAKPDPR